VDGAVRGAPLASGTTRAVQEGRPEAQGPPRFSVLFRPAVRRPGFEFANAWTLASCNDS
jgi:hypothetical protein